MEAHPPHHPTRNSYSNSAVYFALPYLALIFGCIFFRVEYWPLSDFRVFSFYHTPHDIRAYRLGLALNGEFVGWLYEGEELKKNRLFYNEIIFVVESHPELIKKLMRPHLSKAQEKVRAHSLNANQLILYSQDVILEYDELKEIKDIPKVSLPL